jgi:hypothetical protein
MQTGDIENRFNYHPPPDQGIADVHQMMRDFFKDLAYKIDDLGFDCREKSAAITHLEEGLFWTNAMIARLDDQGNRR